MVAADCVHGLGKLDFAAAIPPCDICDLSKQTRNSFPRSPNRSTRPLDLIHSDTMGPFPVLGLEDEAYVVTALDDFSGYAETLLVRRKSDAASTLVDLMVRWQRQVGRKVKILRTDQGTEFKGALADFCAQNSHGTSSRTVVGAQAAQVIVE